MNSNSLSTGAIWPKIPPLFMKGCVVAADLTQEWILPWWWDHYSSHNTLPVAFVDFGMSFEMKKWCKERGHYIHLPVGDIFVSEKETFSQEHIAKWEQEHGKHFWENRKAWFKKPLACLKTPYQLSLWTDIDCEVRAPLEPLFSLSLPSSGVMIGKEYAEGRGIGVNSGVILFSYGSSLMQSWAQESLEKSHLYIGDQDILSDLIKQGNIPIGNLPAMYNWSRFSRDNPDAAILHLHGNHGKTVIEHQIRKKNIELAGFIE